MAPIHRLLVCLFAAIGLGLASGVSNPTIAADDVPPAARYQVPATNNIDELFEFIDAVQGFRPRSREQYLEHRAQSSKAVVAAAEKILRLEDNKKSAATQKAIDILLQARIDGIDTAEPAERQQILEQFEKTLEGRTLTMGDLRSALGLAMNLEHAKGSNELAAQAYADFAKLFAGNPRFQSMAERFTGAARRMSLIGKPLKLKLNTLDGHPFIWDRYRGKVVLVDFWATWCGPCLAELPNVKESYEKYHDRGFDVVGISVDDDREELDNFLAKEKLPWVTLNEKKDDDGRAPVADYYGIISIPAVFLVDRDGKVISLSARGEELDELLAKIFGADKTSSGNPAAKIQ